MNGTADSRPWIHETQNVLLERRNGGSWRELAATLGVSHVALWHINTGQLEHVSWDNFNAVRVALGLSAIPRPVEVPPCPTCAGVHVAGDCHGKTVVQVVALSSEERIYRRRPVRRWRDLPVAALRAALEQRQPYEPRP